MTIRWNGSPILCQEKRHPVAKFSPIGIPGYAHSECSHEIRRPRNHGLLVYNLFHIVHQCRGPSNSDIAFLGFRGQIYAPITDDCCTQTHELAPRAAAPGVERREGEGDGLNEAKSRLVKKA